MAEDERGVLVEDLDGVPEGRQRLRRALVPPPLPDRVEMGVADEVDRRSACYVKSHPSPGRFLYQVKYRMTAIAAAAPVHIPSCFQFRRNR